MDKQLTLKNPEVSEYYKGKFSSKLEAEKNKFLEELYNNSLSYLMSLPIVGQPFNSYYFTDDIKKSILNYIENFLENNNKVVTFNLLPEWPFYINFNVLLVYGPVSGRLNIGI